jgi:hypothetical protein
VIKAETKTTALTTGAVFSGRKRRRNGPGISLVKTRIPALRKKARNGLTDKSQVTGRKLSRRAGQALGEI